MESRYSERVPVECSVLFAGEAGISEGRVIDVSLPGSFMESSESARPGDYVQMKLFLPDQQPAISVPLAVVRWMEGGRIAVEFIRSSEEDQARLMRFVQRHRRASTIPMWQGGIELLSAAGE